MKRMFIFFVVVAMLAAAPLQLSSEARANASVPEFSVYMNPGYLVLDVAPGGNPTGEISCTVRNDCAYNLDLRVTIEAPGFVVTPETSIISLAGGGDMTFSVTVSATPWESGRGNGYVTVELEGVEGSSEFYNKERHAQFIIAAPPFGRLSVVPRELHVPDEGWYETHLTVVNEAPTGQFFDVAFESDSKHFKLEAGSSRFFIGEGDTMDIQVLVWCGKEGATGEADVTFTPDYGNPETMRLALNKGEYDIEEQVVLPPPSSAKPGAAPVILLLLAALGLLVIGGGNLSRSGGRTAFSMVLLLLLVSLTPALPTGEAVSTVVMNPGLMPMNRDQLFYQTTATVSNSDTYEKTVKLTIFGDHLLFAYTREWVVPGQGSLDVPITFMKDFYQETAELSVTAILDEIESEGLAISPLPYSATGAFQAAAPGDDIFHGTLDGKRLRQTGEEDAGLIKVELQSGSHPPRLELLVLDPGTGDWEFVKEMNLSGEAEPGGILNYDCLLESDEMKTNRPYAVRLYFSEDENDHSQTLQLIYARYDDDSGLLPGFEGVILILAFLALGMFRRQSGSKQRNVHDLSGHP